MDLSSALSKANIHVEDDMILLEVGVQKQGQLLLLIQTQEVVFQLEILLKFNILKLQIQNQIN